VTTSSKRHEPLFDTHPVTGASIKVFYADGLATFGQGHHPTVRLHSPTFTFLNNDGHKSHFRLRGRSPKSHGIRRVSWYLPW
jgi:hypothetical protein